MPRFSLLLSRVMVLLALIVIAGCADLKPRNVVPPFLTDEAQPVGFEDVRLWGDHNDPEHVIRLMTRRAESLRTRFGALAEAGITPEMKYLAISGGGQYGAFSAGAITAWTKTGTRPVFDGVTGISTGSIIAPFAFLGPEYDDVLEEIYTTTKTEDMLTETLLSGVLSGSSLADTTPLREKIAHYVTPELLEKIAAEHRKGRLLLVGTTNLDVGRPVVWNMGAIAASDNPGALELFRQVILASAAIPIAFPPVFFEVHAAGQTYDEMHVDGGVTSQVNAFSPQVPSYLLDDLAGFRNERELFVLVNGAMVPPPKAVEARVHKIGAASINALWYAQAAGDLYKINAVTERDGIAVSYGWIPADFLDQPKEEFDPVFMRKLFDLGHAMILDGTMWRHEPPNFTMPGTASEEEVIALEHAAGG
ncbi:patatin-like phospholipase family protein [Rhodobacteraceae bacterium NNCM2]|nr:patatin-like phospholipase family protein [Coraliihabitans acroporae]